MGNDSGCASVTLTSVHQAGLPSFLSTGAMVPGAGATPALPAEVAICATLRTAGRGPSNRGRMFLMGFNASQAAIGNIIAPQCVTDTAAWVANIANVLTSQGLTWVIGQPARNAYTGETGTAHPARPAGSVPITQALIRDNHWDSQRRRGLK
jgi:hypothetical protein